MNRRSFAICMLALLGLGIPGDAAERSLKISIEPGSAYTQKAKMGLMTLTVIPQMAIWIEAEDGRFVDTIYVTKKSATGKWSAAGGSRRPESLPVWSHARGIKNPDGGYMPDKKSALPDAVSGATPSKAYEKSWKLPASLVPGIYKIKVELNSSFDWNDSYPDKLPKSHPRYSEVNGQPSVVYEATLELGRGASGAASVILKPVGTGARRGEDGKVSPGLEGLTTALKLVESIRAEY